MEKKLGRPKVEGDKRTVPLNLRITEKAKSQLRAICEHNDGVSETQAIIGLISSEHKRLKLSTPQP